MSRFVFKVSRESLIEQSSLLSISRFVSAEEMLDFILIYS